MNTSPTYLPSVTFDDGFQVALGDLISFSTRHGSQGSGHVRAIVKPSRGPIRVRLALAPGTVLEGMDSWTLSDGSQYQRPVSEGLYGGELVRPGT